MDPPINFIIVDDDKLVNMFCSMLIKKVFSQADVKTFEFPESGLEYIETAQSIVEAETPTVLFLDINMPTMTGWEFLDCFEQLDGKVKNRIKIYMLSSSVDERDKERAAANQYVKAYLTKPLSREMLLSTTKNGLPHG
ncbi:MAG: response regulator [Bacteroidetes bacterium]|nr:response regulator [Bacteroidota bacterium]